MTVTGRSRPLTSHPAFTPLIALWFAALLGLGLAVVPAGSIEPTLAALGLEALVPLTVLGRIVICAVVSLVGGLLGLVLARRVVHHAGGDPRPVYAEADVLYEEEHHAEPVRRPLRVREELDEDFSDAIAAPRATVPRDEGFMILTPQPIHPPRATNDLEPDLDTLLEQFDSAFDNFQAGEETRPRAETRADPVQTFVAQQTGVAPPAPTPAPSPLGGLVPDHQAELRAALDKLARSQRGE